MLAVLPAELNPDYPAGLKTDRSIGISSCPGSAAARDAWRIRRGCIVLQGRIACLIKIRNGKFRQ
jgi:hypothetical protein